MQTAVRLCDPDGMPDPIFERYKEALRAGHVAALRGRPDDALARYREAGALAPDRPLPHVGTAEVLLRLGRHDDAFVASATALRLAPDDEAVLDVAARCEEAAGNGTKAAAHLDRLADVREAAGRTDAALEAAMRAHELAATGRRSERVTSLREQVESVRSRLSSRDWEGAEVAPPDGVDASPKPAPERPGAATRDSQAGAGAPAGPADAETAGRDLPAPAGSGDAEAAGRDLPAPSVPPDHAAPAVVAEPAGAVPGGPPPAAESAGSGHGIPAHVAQGLAGLASQPAGEHPPPLPGDVAFLAGEDRADAGDTDEAARLYLEAAATYLAMGAVDTAVDTCLRALARAPADLDVHLALARVQASTGHEGRAREAADLLSRLLTLRGDTPGLERVSAFLSTLDGSHNRI